MLINVAEKDLTMAEAGISFGDIYFIEGGKLFSSQFFIAIAPTIAYDLTNKVYVGWFHADSPIIFKKERWGFIPRKEL